MPVSCETIFTERVYPALNATASADLVFWTKATLYEFAHDAVQRFARAVAGLIFTDAVAIVTDQGEYALPARTLSVLHVTAAGRSLRPANGRDLEARSSNWRGDSSVVVSHYARQDEGLSTLRVYPKPATGLSGSVKATVHRGPAVVSDLAPTLDWPEVLSGYLGLRVIAAARSAETEAKMPEAAAVAGQICSVVEQAGAALWGGVQ